MWPLQTTAATTTTSTSITTANATRSSSREQRKQQQQLSLFLNQNAYFLQQKAKKVGDKMEEEGSSLCKS
jgi:hypothetical protein